MNKPEQIGKETTEWYAVSMSSIQLNEMERALPRVPGRAKWQETFGPFHSEAEAAQFAKEALVAGQYMGHDFRVGFRKNMPIFLLPKDDLDSK